MKMDAPDLDFQTRDRANPPGHGLLLANADWTGNGLAPVRILNSGRWPTSADIVCTDSRCRWQLGYRVRAAGHREYDAVTPCWELGAAKIGASVLPAWTEPPGALSWVSLTSPKGVGPRSARLVQVPERLAGHGLSPRDSSSERCSS